MKDNWTKDVRLPGVLWVVVLVGGTWAILTYLPQDAWIILIPMLLLFVGKALNLGTDQIEALVVIAKTALSYAPPASRHVRLVPGETGEPVVTRNPNVPIDAQDIEKFKPNRTIRFLLG